MLETWNHNALEVESYFGCIKPTATLSTRKGTKLERSSYSLRRRYQMEREFKSAVHLKECRKTYLSSVAALNMIYIGSKLWWGRRRRRKTGSRSYGHTNASSSFGFGGEKDGHAQMTSRIGGKHVDAGRETCTLGKPSSLGSSEILSHFPST